MLFRSLSLAGCSWGGVRAGSRDRDVRFVLKVVGSSMSSGGSKIVASPLWASSMTRVSSAVRSSGSSAPGGSTTMPTLLPVFAFPVRRSAIRSENSPTRENRHFADASLQNRRYHIGRGGVWSGAGGMRPRCGQRVLVRRKTWMAKSPMTWRMASEPPAIRERPGRGGWVPVVSVLTGARLGCQWQDCAADATCVVTGVASVGSGWLGRRIAVCREHVAPVKRMLPDAARRVS